MTMPTLFVTLASLSVPNLPMAAWLILAGLAYLLVTCVLNALAIEVRNERERHDLIVQARQRRMEYRRMSQRVSKAND